MVKEVTYIAMGCFWGPEYIFSKTKGVVETEVGYLGGNEKKFPQPTYKQVCSGQTGYAETVKIIFDNKKIKYGEILDIFWKNHDPTQVGGQGVDIGSQYRSTIFYNNEKQKKVALESKKKWQKKFKGKITSEILAAKTFFKAEEYHQKYAERTGRRVC